MYTSTETVMHFQKYLFPDPLTAVKELHCACKNDYTQTTTPLTHWHATLQIMQLVSSLVTTEILLAHLRCNIVFYAVSSSQYSAVRQDNILATVLCHCHPNPGLPVTSSPCL